jgi:hypothetical protein
MNSLCGLIKEAGDVNSRGDVFVAQFGYETIYDKDVTGRILLYFRWRALMYKRILLDLLCYVIGRNNCQYGK